MLDKETEVKTEEAPLQRHAEGSVSGEERDVSAEATAGKDDNDAAKGDSSRMDAFDWLQCIVTALVCGIFIFVFIGRTIGVDGRSMLQTLHHHDRVVMSSLFFKPKQGDIIIFHSSAADFGGTPLVKRVIAVAGQTVDINFETSEVFVDGKVIDEPYINEPTRSREDFTGPVTVPVGCVFVMGDNRNNSSDSRDHRVGMVDTRYILGKVLFPKVPDICTIVQLRSYTLSISITYSQLSVEHKFWPKC